MSWTPLEIINPPDELEKTELSKKQVKPQVIGVLFENSTIVETIDFGEHAFTEFGSQQTTIKFVIKNQQAKLQWANLHVRHKIRISISLTLLFLFASDLTLNILGLTSIWDAFSDLLSVIGAFGLLGTSVYLAIDPD
jgi:hypothetical protein